MWHNISKIVSKRFYTYQPNWNNFIEKHWTLHIEQLKYPSNDIQCSLSTIRCRANSYTCGNFINLRLFNKLQNIWCHTRLGGGLRNVTICDKDGGGVKKSWNLCDLIYGWPLIHFSKFPKLTTDLTHNQFILLTCLLNSL